MRKLKRPELSQGSLTILTQRTKKISNKGLLSEKVAEAKRLWNQKCNKAFNEIRKKLRQMAPGIERCMYCEDSAGTDIEHFRPKSLYPLETFEWNNYLLACTTCNSNYKRTEFPLDADDKPLLINPVEDEPRDHIDFAPSTGHYTGLSTKGSESIRVYGLNRSTLRLGRRDAWTSVQLHIIQYGIKYTDGKNKEARQIKELICRFPHASVFTFLIDIFDSPAAPRFIEAQCIQTIQQYPEIKKWMD